MQPLAALIAAEQVSIYNRGWREELFVLTRNILIQKWSERDLNRRHLDFLAQTETKVRGNWQRHWDGALYGGQNADVLLTILKRYLQLLQHI